MKFRAELRLHGRTATGIEVPDEVVEGLGAGKRPAVRVSLLGHTYSTTIAPMGGVYLIPVSAEHRTAAGATAGQTVEVTVELDDARRTVTLPADLAAALAADPEAMAFYETLAFTYQKEYARWVTDAKRPETRSDRVVKSVAALRAGRKTH